jgi:transposase-like protein
MRFKRKQWTAATLNEMLQLYRDGVSVADLAKIYDVTASAIRQQASKYGVTRTAEYLSTVRREASGLPGVRND